MTGFRFGIPRSFGAKLTLLVTLTSGLAVVLVCVVLVVLDYIDTRRERIAMVAIQANIIAINSQAPLAFNDLKAESEALAALKNVPEIRAARVFQHNGEMFAEYVAAKHAIPPAFELDRPGRRIIDRWLVITNAVIDEQNQEIGTVQVVYDMAGLTARVRSNSLASLAVAALATLVAFLLAIRIRTFLAKPVGELARTAQQISKTRDFSIRAAKYSDDELGQFTDNFNEMLAQIQQQDIEIQAAHQQRAQLLESERSARTEAERASHMKDEFVATLSHELRTPLTAILGWAQMLRKGAVKPDDAGKGLEIIERNARMQTQIIEDLLDMSRIISGKIRLDVQQVNLIDVIEASLTTVRPAAEAKDIRLQSVLDPHVGPVRGDPNRLQQVIWNLVSNAIKFTGRGGRVQVALERVNSHVEITVSDTGQGIKPEFLPHVFERFRQADSSTTRQHAGLGLGLAIVKQLIELHGGAVRAKSAGEGMGATFSVELPLMAIHAPHEPASREHPRVSKSVVTGASTLSLKGRRVLVVDDEADTRELVTRILRDAEAEVASAGSVNDAMQTLNAFRPDVVISDIGMPVQDGYDFIRKVRQSADVALASTPAAALTAFARSEDRTRALLAGYQMHLAKPVEPSELIATVASLAGLASGRTPERSGAQERS